MTDVQYAESFSPDACRDRRQVNLELARRCHRAAGRTGEIFHEAVERARFWHRLAMAGGNEAFKYERAKVIEHGEKVDKDFGNLCVWARTITGQGIASDGVIKRIAKGCMS